MGQELSTPEQAKIISDRRVKIPETCNYCGKKAARMWLYKTTWLCPDCFLRFRSAQYPMIKWVRGRPGEVKVFDQPVDYSKGDLDNFEDNLKQLSLSGNIAAVLNSWLELTRIEPNRKLDLKTLITLNKTAISLAEYMNCCYQFPINWKVYIEAMRLVVKNLEDALIELRLKENENY